MKLQAQRINTKSEKGIALILALILMTLIFLLTLSAFEMVTVNTQIADNQIRDLQALYVAEAGIDDAIYQLRYETYPATITDINGSCGPGNYTAKSTVIDNKRYRIDSDGTIIYSSTRTSTRTIRAVIRLYGQDVPYTVVITSWEEIL
jgi:Tfp pilus assembly protein PilX